MHKCGKSNPCENFLRIAEESASNPEITRVASKLLSQIS